MADSPYQLAARREYRYATIVRDGEWGVVFHCYIGKKICLCLTEIEAARLVAGKCKAEPCSGNHTVEKFEAVPVPQPVWESRIWETD
jgi:hypothetical protein